MDDSSITGRIKKLRREIELIRQEERLYRNYRVHSLAERADHDQREVRVVAIRDELKGLVEKTKQRQGHGLVWYG